MDRTRFIVAGSLIDGTGVGVRRNAVLIVEDGIITAVGGRENLPRDPGAPVDDLSPCTIVPALVDGSVFLGRSPAIDPKMRGLPEEASREQRLALRARHLRYCHDHGVLGVVDGDDPFGLARHRADGTMPGGPVALRTAGPLCRSWDEAAGGSSDRDFLRIGYSPDINAAEATQPRMSREELRRIVQHGPDCKKIVVANGREAVAEALAAGCDAIEQGFGMGEDNLRTMAARQVLWLPGVVRAKNGLDGSASGGEVCCRFSLRFAAPGQANPGAEAFWKATLAGQLAQLRLARALGVPTAVGTGAGSPGILHGESVVEEIKLFIKAGFPLAEAIAGASAVGAGFFGMEALGPLTVGRRATFLVTRGTPQQLPRKLGYLENIYIDGAPSRAYRKDPVKAAGQGAQSSF